jgi:hypothetical protein
MRLALFVCAAGLCLAQEPVTLSGPVRTAVDEPITAAERLQWSVYSTIGPPNLTAGLFKSGWTTLFDDPPEYGPHWEGFGKRYALRLSGSATSNFMEAGIGGLWGEDPRYKRSPGRSAGNRVWHVVTTAFTAYDRSGKSMPAYARYIAIPGSNIVANAWRPDSQVTIPHTAMRTSIGFLSHIAANAFEEFWPDVRKHVLRQKD